MNERITATLTVKEISQILKVGSNTAYNLIHSKSFPVKKVGHSYRIPAASFFSWLEGCMIEPIMDSSANTSRGTAVQS